MSGRCLLDTNIVIALFADEASVKNRLPEAEEVLVSSVTIGELYFGAWKSTQPDVNRARIEEFAAAGVVLGCETETARRYGEVKHTLRLKGRPIPENDIWIAAIALQHDLTLITRAGHFKAVDNLKVEVW